MLWGYCDSGGGCPLTTFWNPFHRRRLLYPLIESSSPETTREQKMLGTDPIRKTVAFSMWIGRINEMEQSIPASWGFHLKNIMPLSASLIASLLFIVLDSRLRPLLANRPCRNRETIDP